MPKKSFTTVDELVSAGLIASGAAGPLQSVIETFALRVTPHLQSQLHNPAIARQYLPAPEELTILPDELADPIGDQIFTPIKGITHRYPDRVLFKPTHSCAVYCRFCFRRETVGHPEEALSGSELDAALSYIQAHHNIWEVILSGGDPLVLSDRRLGIIVSALSTMDHISVLRLHTRALVADPARITPSLVASLKSRLATYVAIHVNHADEITPDVKRAFALMVDNGIPLLSQTVLLKGINDSAAELTRLMRALVANRVKPYYLHHPDMAKGTSHFRVAIAEGQNLMQQLRGDVSGLCQPTYMLDIPGGYGKVPIGPGYVTDDKVRDPAGNEHPLPGG